jgi:hypothetical protein
MSRRRRANSRAASGQAGAGAGRCDRAAQEARSGGSQRPTVCRRCCATGAGAGSASSSPRQAERSIVRLIRGRLVSLRASASMASQPAAAAAGVPVPAPRAPGRRRGGARVQQAGGAARLLLNLPGRAGAALPHHRRDQRPGRGRRRLHGDGLRHPAGCGVRQGRWAGLLLRLPPRLCRRARPANPLAGSLLLKLPPPAFLPAFLPPGAGRIGFNFVHCSLLLRLGPVRTCTRWRRGCC